MFAGIVLSSLKIHLDFDAINVQSISRLITKLYKIWYYYWRTLEQFFNYNVWSNTEELKLMDYFFISRAKSSSSRIAGWNDAVVKMYRGWRNTR